MSPQGSKYRLLPFWVFQFCHESAAEVHGVQVKGFKNREKLFFFFWKPSMFMTLCHTLLCYFISFVYICLNWRKRWAKRTPFYRFTPRKMHNGFLGSISAFSSERKPKYQRDPSPLPPWACRCCPILFRSWELWQGVLWLIGLCWLMSWVGGYRCWMGDRRIMLSPILCRTPLAAN